MVGQVEVLGYVIVGAVAGQVVLGLYGAMRRRYDETKWAEESRKIFEQRARLLLESEQAERDRNQLSWNGQRKFFIEQIVTETKDIRSFYLRPHDQKPLAPFLPGQYLTFQLKIPGQEKPVIRCYSLSDSPLEKDHYRVTIKRLGPPPKNPDMPPGLSSSYFHSALKEGDILDVRAPSGQFYLDQASERPVVLVAGGVGITPLLSMLNTICGSSSKRETWLFYGVTNRSEHAMYRHFKELQDAHDNVHIVPCYSQPSDQCVEGRDYEHRGFVSVDLMKTLLPSSNYDFYLCGPPPMMETVTNDLRDWGVPEEHVHFEAFGPATVKRAAEPSQASATADAIEVRFTRSKKILNWTPDCGTILDLAEANGIKLDSGCRAGNCGTCLSAIRDGQVRYLSEPGAACDEGSCLVCVAVPKSALVIEG